MNDTNELIGTLKDAVLRLNDLKIDYMVTGSVAMSCYATARTTMDIDIIVELRKFDANRFKSRFDNDYYVDETSIRNAQQRQSMFNVLNFETGVKVDFIIRKATPFEAEKFGRRRLVKLVDAELWAIGKEDLVLSKLEWAKQSHSELQFRDVRNLIESGVDEVFIDRMIALHDLREVWEAFSEWKIRIAK